MDLREAIIIEKKKQNKGEKLVLDGIEDPGAIICSSNKVVKAREYQAEKERLKGLQGNLLMTPRKKRLFLGK